MMRTILIGSVGVGKTTLFNALRGLRLQSAEKTQSVEYDDSGNIDTPGEFFAFPHLYPMLLSLIQDSECILYVHAADDEDCRIPSGLLSVYASLPIFAVITKSDLPNADVERTKAILSDAGLQPPFFVVNKNDVNALNTLQTFLEELAHQKYHQKYKE